MRCSERLILPGGFTGVQYPGRLILADVTDTSSNGDLSGRFRSEFTAAGGLFTSAQALKDGYGHTCKMKVRHEELAKEEAKNQYSLFDTTKEG